MLSRELNHIQWEENTTATPQYIEVKIDVNVVLSSIATLVNLLSFLGCLLSIGFIATFRNNRIFSSAQPFCLCIICIGSAAIALSGIILEVAIVDGVDTQRELDGMCSLFPRFFFSGIIAVYLAMLGKMWRIYEAKKVQTKQSKRLWCSFLWGTIVKLAIEGAVINAWISVDPPVWKTKIVSQDDGLEDCRSIGYCDYSNTDPTFFLLFMALIVLSAMLGHWLSRNIDGNGSEEWSDGKPMHWVFLVHSVLLLIYILVYSVGSYLTIRFLSSIIDICVVFPLSVTTLGLLVAPTCYGVFYERTHGGKLPKFMKGTRMTGGTIVTSPNADPFQRNIDNDNSDDDNGTC